MFIKREINFKLVGYKYFSNPLENIEEAYSLCIVCDPLELETYDTINGKMVSSDFIGYATANLSIYSSISGNVKMKLPLYGLNVGFYYTLIFTYDSSIGDNGQFTYSLIQRTWLKWGTKD